MKPQKTFCAFITIGLSALFSAVAPCQNLTGKNLEISETATINNLEVSGPADFQNDTLYLGTFGTEAALIIQYSESYGGGVSDFSLTSASPSTFWVWRRTTSGAIKDIFRVDELNRLILSGTNQSNPPQIILDPNTGISINGNGLLTQTAANSLYFPSGAGLSSTNGRIGIGTTLPQAALHVVGDSLMAGSLSLFSSG